MSGGAWLRWGLFAAAAGGVALWFTLGAQEEGAGSGRRGRGGPRAAAVSTAAVEVGPLTERATWPGELAADTADVAANVAGRLAEVNVRLGDAVEARQPLARVEIAELAESQAEAAAAARAAAATERRAGVELAAGRRELERAEKLAKGGIVSQQSLAEQRSAVAALGAASQAAKAASAQADARVELLARREANSVVAAPFAGVVSARALDPGSYVSPGQTVVRLVARRPLRVRFEVPEGEVGGVPVGGRFAVMAPPTGADEHEGVVTGVASEVDRERRVVVIEGVVEAPPQTWLPGMFVEVVTARRSLEEATTVPARALVTRLSPEGVVETGVLRPEEGVARWVGVEVLAREAERVAVAGEVTAGQRVLVGGHADLADGATIKIVDDAIRGAGEGAPKRRP